MSTRSTIIIKLSENHYKGIYCHNDGYPEGVGATLLAHYQEPAKVVSLISLGDISSLGDDLVPNGPHSFDKPEKGVTLAYMRDRDEVGIEAVDGESEKEITDKFDNDYTYLFADGVWTVNGEILSSFLKGAVNV